MNDNKWIYNLNDIKLAQPGRETRRMYGCRRY